MNEVNNNDLHNVSAYKIADTKFNLLKSNPILGKDEIGFELDTNEFKIGDGVSYWNDLEYYKINSSLTSIDIDKCNKLNKLAHDFKYMESNIDTIFQDSILYTKELTTLHNRITKLNKDFTYMAICLFILIMFSIIVSCIALIK